MENRKRIKSDYFKKWDDFLCIGIEEIDEEHRMFFELIDNATYAGEIGYKEFSIAFQKLMSHIVWHFKNEEEYMKNKSISSAYISTHNYIHAQCLYELSKMHDAIVMKDSEDGMFYQKELAYSVLCFVNNWLVFHILSEDYKISKQIEHIEEGYSPKEAYEMLESEVSANVKILTSALSNLLKIYEVRNEKLVEVEADITARLEKKEKQLQEQIQENKKKSITDELTGLYNRRYAMNVLNNIWSIYQDPTCSIIQIDLDKFKEVNDTYGHHSGDLVLRQFSSAVKYFFETDDLCNKYSNKDMICFCRLGGDEFLVILQKYSLDEAIKIANNLHTVINNIEVFNEYKKVIWRGSASIGVACRNADNQDFESVLRAADTYLYKAKDSGRNCVRSMLHEIGGGCF
ncbi:GGDEF domain-containing protein [Campylobacter sp. MG1]|uniref:GGDEF domain-containing protein n=1 Tax=Campylobacter sp. MG1 TaxID=2976332 RepID=UPI00226CE86B|nr:diguanylate cyclase [Campylobacter sp. MG1]